MNKNHCVSKIYILFFIVYLFILGMICFFKLSSFYIYDEVNYNEWNPDLGNKLESDIATNFVGKNVYINMNGLMRRIIGQNEMNGVVRLNNGYLISPIKKADEELIRSNAENIINLSTYANKNGQELLYVVPLYTLDKYGKELPEGIYDYGNENYDRFLSILLEADVDTIDVRKFIHDDEINHYDMVYRTDHHWNSEAGFYVYTLIENYIKTNTGCIVDDRISQLDYYDVIKYKKQHLGSNGQRTGKYFAGIDDFDLIMPRFDIEVRNAVTGIKQDARLALYNLEPLEHKNVKTRYVYDDVLGKSQSHYVNDSALNDLKILVVSDSYSKCVLPYLIMGFREVEYKEWYDSSSITSLSLKENEYDVIIVLYYSAKLNDDSGFHFCEE